MLSLSLVLVGVAGAAAGVGSAQRAGGGVVVLQPAVKTTNSDSAARIMAPILCVELRAARTNRTSAGCAPPASRERRKDLSSGQFAEDCKREEINETRHEVPLRGTDCGSGVAPRRSGSHRLRKRLEQLVARWRRFGGNWWLWSDRRFRQYLRNRRRKCRRRPAVPWRDLVQRRLCADQLRSGELRLLRQRLRDG